MITFTSKVLSTAVTALVFGGAALVAAPAHASHWGGYDDFAYRPRSVSRVVIIEKRGYRPHHHHGFYGGPVYARPAFYGGPVYDRHASWGGEAHRPLGRHGREEDSYLRLKQNHLLRRPRSSAGLFSFNGSTMGQRHRRLISPELGYRTHCYAVVRLVFGLAHDDLPRLAPKPPCTPRPYLRLGPACVYRGTMDRSL